MKKSCFFSVLTASYIKGFKVFCKSLIESNPWIKDVKPDFLIIPLDLSEKDKKLCENYYSNIIWKDKTSIPIDPSKTKIGESAFYKLSAFSIYNYDLVISIDCADMIAVKPIGELFSYQNEISMVQGWTSGRKWQQFNGGLVVLNKRFRNPNTYKKLIEQPVTNMYDQDIINNFFKNKIRSIPYTFNFTKRMIHNKDLDLNKAKIIHYVCEKPWEDYPGKEEYKEIEKIWHEKSKL